MAQTLATYDDRDGQRHTIELVDHDGDRLVIDRGGDGPARVIAELGDDEGPRQACCLLDGDGAYLERARGGERGLCRAFADDASDGLALGRAA
jgi:hypothetical protein